MRLSDATLAQHAAILTSVLRQMRQRKKDLTSDMLWQHIKERWEEKELDDALQAFTRSGSFHLFLELFIDLPIAGKDGFALIKDEPWGTLYALQRRIGITYRTLKRYTCKLTRLLGRDAMNRVAWFYRLKEVERVCASLLVPDMQVVDKGSLTEDDERWCSVRDLHVLINLHGATIKKRIQHLSCRQIKVRGRVRTYYRLTDVQTACADLLNQTLIETDTNGIGLHQDESWASVMSLVALLDISQAAIETRKDQCRSVEGRDRSNRPCLLYAVADMRLACKDLLNPALPVASKEGTFAYQGEIWASKRALKELYHITNLSGDNEKYLSVCRTRTGKSSTGNIRVFYAVSDVKKIFSKQSKKERARLRLLADTSLVTKYEQCREEIVKCIQRTHPKTTLDLLRQKILARWTKVRLKNALAAFERHRNANAFLPLLS